VSPLFGTDDLSIGSHVSGTFIDWLTHNNARDEITLRFILFLNVICCTFISFMSFVLSFFVICVV